MPNNSLTFVAMVYVGAAIHNLSRKHFLEILGYSNYPIAIQVTVASMYYDMNKCTSYVRLTYIRIIK